MRIHLAIVSDQLLPTVIPCLMDRPDRVVLVASRRMTEQARRLQDRLREEGLVAEVREGAPDAGLDQIRAYATRLANELTAGTGGDEVIVNATGGTKLMTLGFIDAFRDRAVRIIYTDTAHQQIEVVYERGTPNPQPVPMVDVLDVPRYLAVQGFRYQRDALHEATRLARIERRRDVARGLAHQAARSSGLIPWLNRLAHAALDEKGNELVNPVQPLDRTVYGEWRKLLDRCVDAGVLELACPSAVRFVDAEAARFLGGGWLEEYAFAAVREAGVHDVRLGVTGVWHGTERARNEFDVLACHRNQLLFIECKTLKFKEGQNDRDLAYKVDSLGNDIRGLFGATWVLAAQEPTPVLRDCAKQFGFLLIGPRWLSSLPQRVELWKKGQSPEARG
jgi:hypothetical protein